MSDSDEEYGPICSTWGTQAPAAQSNDDNTDAWKTLIDPNVKVGPNDLGSGNLHRQGRNFKPIDEELILAQRNKVQISKKKTKKSSSTTTSSPSSTKKKSISTPTNKHKPKEFNNNIPQFTTLRPPPPPQQNSAWSSSNLVETPFWEKKAEATPIVNTPAVNEEWKALDTGGWGNTNTTTNTTNTTAPVTGWKEYDLKQEQQNKQQQQQKQYNWGPLEENTNGSWANVDKKQQQQSVNNGWANVDKQLLDHSSRHDVNKKEDRPKEVVKESSGWSNNNTKVAQDGWDSIDKTPKNTTWNDGSDRWASDTWSTKSPEYTTLPTSPPPSSRFSIPSKQRYAPDTFVPEPINYKRNGKSIPTATAPPPPPENRHVITINVELSKERKISVEIRELDEPSKLAEEFARTNNISSDKVVEALTTLFSNQKEQALKLKNKKLQRRVVKQRPVNNNFPDYSAYESSPAYQPVATTTTTTTSSFSRKAYY